MTDIVTSELILSNKIPTLETIQLNNKLSKEQKKLLKNYKDKSLIISILAKRSYDFFSTIQSFVNIPLILSSTTLAILNSASLTGDAMKIPNIVINSVTGLTLALISNFKISDKVSIFKNLATKMNKLNTRIEESIANDEDITTEKLSSFIREFETLQDTCDFSFPTSIKKKVYERYKNKGFILPNALIGFDDISIEDLNANNMNGLNSV